jgi:hypothetical protein
VASFSETPRPRTAERVAPRLRAEVVASLAVLAYIVSLAIGVAR